MTYPRVTTILDAVGLGPCFDGARAGDLEAALLRGQAFDRLVEAHHYGYEEEVAPEVAPYYEAYLKFVADTGHTPIKSQFTVRSARWRYEGHPDRLGWLQGFRCIPDWKCVATVQKWPTMRQLAAYRLAWNEEHPGEPVALVCAVQFRPDATYRIHEFTKDDLARAESEFLAAVTVWHAKERR